MSESRGFVFRRNSMAYVYGHYKADTGELFYIGKGTGNRAWVLTGRNSYWNNVVNKHGVEIKILYDGLTDEDAYEKEKEVIAEVGLENLTNITEGGEGITSDLAKELFAHRWSNDEYRKKHLEGVRKRSENPEWREMMKRIVQDPAWRKKVDAKNKQQAKDPEWRRKQKEGAQQNKENVIRNKKISEKVKSYWDNNPDDDRNKRLAKDPMWREKVTEKNKQMAQDPEWRRKQKEGIRLYWENKRKLKQTET